MDPLYPPLISAPPSGGVGTRSRESETYRMEPQQNCNVVYIAYRRHQKDGENFAFCATVYFLYM